MIIWPLDTTSAHQNLLTSEEMREVMRMYPELCGSYIRGSPICLNVNTNPEKGLANGSQVRYN
jgi:hypothetical protein